MFCGFEFTAVVRAIRVAALGQLYQSLDKTFGLSIAIASLKRRNLFVIKNLSDRTMTMTILKIQFAYDLRRLRPLGQSAGRRQWRRRFCAGQGVTRIYGVRAGRHSGE